MTHVRRDGGGGELARRGQKLRGRFDGDRRQEAARLPESRWRRSTSGVSEKWRLAAASSGSRSRCSGRIAQLRDERWTVSTRASALRAFDVSASFLPPPPSSLALPVPVPVADPFLVLVPAPRVRRFRTRAHAPSRPRTHPAFCNAKLVTQPYASFPPLPPLPSLSPRPVVYNQAHAFQDRMLGVARDSFFISYKTVATFSSTFK